MFSKSMLVLLFFLSFSLCASDNFFEKIQLTENLCKMKVTLSEILVQEDGIYYLCKDRHPIQVSGLQFEAGSYTAITPKDVIENVFGIWWCYNCQKWNSKFDHSCQYCGRPR